MRSFIRATGAILVTVAMIAFGQNVADAFTQTPFVSFSQFIKNTESAKYSSFAAAGHSAGPQAFDQMRSYVLGMYKGVKVKHSFVSGGDYTDCVTVDSQPSVKALGIKKLATPPAPSERSAAGAGNSDKAAPSPLTLGQKDEYGNAISCDTGTIPMRRFSLDRMTRFSSLKAYLAKQPISAGNQTLANAHRYAYGYENVTNFGGNSWINLWNPSGEFSLSQQWFVDDAGASTQTVEGGWVHYPAKFGNESVLFIFFTPDNYASGCYNLECTGFVQTNNNWHLGAKWNNYSTYGGTQWGYNQQWKYFQGNWWLQIEGENVGYYPGSVYNGGQLSHNATATKYGGETYTGGSDWPQMGSGKFANQGWQQAAYQNTIFYIPRDEDGGTGVWNSLTPVETNPACYTIAYTPASSGGSWGTYFYYGGPGGTC